MRLRFGQGVFCWTDVGNDEASYKVGGQRRLQWFKLGNDESERWLVTAGSFTVERSDDDSAAGSLDAKLAPAGADAKGPIHVTGSWTCRHSGN